MSPNERPRNDRYAAMARAATSDEDAFERAWRQGREMPLDEAIALAFSRADYSTNSNAGHSR
jgi:hypothetical protein